MSDEQKDELVSLYLGDRPLLPASIGVEVIGGDFGSRFFEVRGTFDVVEVLGTYRKDAIPLKKGAS